MTSAGLGDVDVSTPKVSVKFSHRHRAIIAMRKLVHVLVIATVAACIVMAISGLTGCAGSLESGRDTLAAKRASDQRMAAQTGGPVAPLNEPYCQSLDAQRRTWGAFAKGSALLGGGAGVAAIEVDKRWKEQSLAISAAVFAALAAASTYFSEDAGTTWAEQCSVPVQ